MEKAIQSGSVNSARRFIRNPFSYANCRRASSTIRDFARADAGTTVVGFAIIFTVILLGTAVMIDYGRATGERYRMQAALDSAALAASDLLGLPDSDTKGPERAKAFFKANTGHELEATVDSVVMDEQSGEVVISAKGNLLTTLLRSVGINSMEVNTASKVIKGNGNVEIALVLDNSGSMAGTPIEDLRVAARNLVSVVFTGNEGTDRVSFGVVPFAGAVNVGSGNQTALWMDTDGISPIHFENVSTQKKRFTLLAEMGVDWAGCVESRPSPYDVNDTSPSSSTPASMFVPLFAPDEPDSNNSDGAWYSNNYLVDDGGSCTPQPRTCTNYSWRGNCTNWETDPLPPATAQSRVCKYNGGTADTDPAYGTQRGPNMMCDAAKILPLNTNKAIIQDAVDAMIAKGGTNISEGVMWGWRVLSPGAPFTEGRPKEVEKNKKFMIVMSDGANWHGAISNHNTSWYSAFGYASKQRLGAGSSSTSALKAAMNWKTELACTNAKADGIIIYTVAFNLSDTTTRNLLKNCASSSDKALSAGGGAALAATFEQIARDISKLRLSN